METLPRCWWATPWEHERHEEGQLYRDVGVEEECDSNHVLGNEKQYVFDELNTSVEDIDVEHIIVLNEHSVTNVSSIECELKHDLDSLVNEHEGNPLQNYILTFVEVDVTKSYKSTLVTELNGRPTLSKNRPTKIKSSMSYVIPKV